MPEYASISNVIIDDVLLWDGRVFLNCLGGAGTYALAGMRVWCDRLGLVAQVGPDFQVEHRRLLQGMGIDLSGLIVNSEGLTARAWQIFQPDEERIEVFRTKESARYMNTPTFELIPQDFLAARGLHIYWNGSLSALRSMIPILKSINPKMVLVLEPAVANLASSPEEYQSLLPLVTVFSPNALEAQSITGADDPKAMLEVLMSWGAGVVAIRMGDQGSLVGAANGERWQVPPVVRTLVDVTGAGNAYCGGLLVGLGDGLCLRDAALCATVSASFAIEQFSVPIFDAHLPEERAARLALAAEQIRAL